MFSITFHLLSYYIFSIYKSKSFFPFSSSQKILSSESQDSTSCLYQWAAFERLTQFVAVHKAVQKYPDYTPICYHNNRLNPRRGQIA